MQVSRLGNPLVNEVVIPLGQKDRFNRTTPEHDAANYGKFVLKPELAAILNALFGVNAPENNRTDIVQALLQGIPNLNQHSGPHAGKPVDTLKINLGIPPSKTPSRFGVIGGDNAGFPNGRRLADDVVDIELQVVAGILVGNPVPLGDGVDKNDKKFLSPLPVPGGARIRDSTRTPRSGSSRLTRRRRQVVRKEKAVAAPAGTDGAPLGGAPSPGRDDPSTVPKRRTGMKVQRVSGEGSHV